MPTTRLENLSTSLRQVSTKTITKGDLNYGVFSGDADRLKESIITLVRDAKTGKAIAFNALARMETRLGNKPVDVIHLGLVMVDPAFQSKGLSWILYGLTCVLLFLRAGLRPFYISNVTQVPAVVGMVSETFSQVEPSPSNKTLQDFRKVLIGRDIMARHRHVFGVGPEAEFDDKTFIIRNAYTGGSDDLKKLFEVAPKHRDEQYNIWCREALDYDRGDDFLQIGMIDLAAARRYVLRAVPRRSLVSVLLLGFLVFLNRVFIPLYQWLDTGKEFGRLRAR